LDSASALLRNADTRSGEDDSIENSRHALNAAYDVAQVDLVLVRFEKTFKADPLLAPVDMQPTELQCRVILQSALDFVLDFVCRMSRDCGRGVAYRKNIRF
jgi:hypothetical protein